MTTKFPRKILRLLFFLSGFCSLVYQVVWVRLAFSHFGIITPVLSVVVSVFMLGLSLGSWGAGRWVEALTAGGRHSAIDYYAWSEFGIGLGAFCVPILFVEGAKLLQGSGQINSTSYLFLSACVIAACLLPWCLLMGATFPLMAAFIREKDPIEWSSFSSLYSANVLGALAGTVMSAVVLIELLGFLKTLRVTGCLNFGIAAVALCLGRWGSHGKSSLTQKPILAAIPSPEAAASLDRRQVRAILFFTGFVSLASEVVWTRLFTAVLLTTIYAFAYILAVYLLCTWIGSCGYRYHLRRRAVVPTEKLMAFLAVSCFLPIVIPDPRWDVGWLGVGLAIAPGCALLGYLTPKLIDGYSQGSPSPMGGAYALNVLGCISGPLVVSYGILPYIGAKGAMLLLSVPILILLLPFCKKLKPHWAGLTGFLVFALAFYALFGSLSYEERFQQCVIQRDYTATVIATGTGWQRRLVVNGVGMTYLTPATKAMAHLPLLFFHRKPQSALVICFGMGTTYRSLLSYGIETTVVELVPSVVKMFGYYHADAGRCLQNPHGHIVIDDGRRFLERTQDRFDVVTLDPPPPVEAAGSSLLYSKEFYQAVQRHLTPGGVLQQWLPAGIEVRIVNAAARSLVDTFPYVRVYKSSREGEGFHFIASLEPLKPLTPEAWAARMPETAKKDLLEWDSNRNLSQVYHALLARERDPHLWAASDPTVSIRDDQPFNEYYALRRWYAQWKNTYILAE